MSEPRLISPMLDDFIMGDPISEHHGVRCCPALRKDSDSRYIVKIISVPASQVQLDALLLSGAYSSNEAALSYFREMAEDLTREVEILKKLSTFEGFLPYEDCQIVPMSDGVGFDVYMRSPYKRSLERHMQKKPMTHLNAVNMGLDLCASMAMCRRAGLLYVDLKPTNIFVNEKNEFCIGDLGFVRMDSLKYASLPDKYRSPYTAPELADAMSCLNTTVDIYAIGMILYQVYNDGKLPDVSQNGTLSAPLYADYEMAQIILKACNPNPARRWQDPLQMGQALVAYMQRNSVNDVPIVPLPEPVVKTPVVKPAPILQAETVVIPVSKPVVIPEPEPVVVPEPVVTPEPKPVVVPEPEPAVVSEPEPVVVSEPEPMVIPEPEPVVVSEPEPVVVSEPEPVVVPEPEPVVVPEPEPVVVSEPEPVVVPEPEPVVVPEPEPAVESQTENAVAEDTTSGALTEEQENLDVLLERYIDENLDDEPARESSKQKPEPEIELPVPEEVYISEEDLLAAAALAAAKAAEPEPMSDADALAMLLEESDEAGFVEATRKPVESVHPAEEEPQDDHRMQTNEDGDDILDQMEAMSADLDSMSEVDVLSVLLDKPAEADPMSDADALAMLLNEPDDIGELQAEAEPKEPELSSQAGSEAIDSDAPDQIEINSDELESLSEVETLAMLLDKPAEADPMSDADALAMLLNEPDELDAPPAEAEPNEPAHSTDADSDSVEENTLDQEDPAFDESEFESEVEALATFLDKPAEADPSSDADALAKLLDEPDDIPSNRKSVNPIPAPDADALATLLDEPDSIVHPLDQDGANPFDSLVPKQDAADLSFMSNMAFDETQPDEDEIEDFEYEDLSDETSGMLTLADELIAHEPPEPVVAPEPIDIPMPVPIDLSEMDPYSENEAFDPTMETDLPAPSEDSDADFRTSRYDFTEDEEDEDFDDYDEEVQSEIISLRRAREKTKNDKLLKQVIGVVAALLLAGAMFAAAYFYYNHFYLQHIDEMDIVGTGNQLTVQLTTDVDSSLLRVECTDTYGTVKSSDVRDGQAIFTGLNPNTLYTIRVKIDGFHELVGDIAGSYTTPTQTEIVSFTAIAGSEDGSVILNFTPDGQDAANWVMEYSTEGEEIKQQSFTGHMVTITGLTLDKTYTFRITSPNLNYIVGKDTLTFTATTLVVAENLAVTGCNDAGLTAKWDVPEGAEVTNWVVRCYNDSGYDETVTTTESTVTFTGIDPAAAYTVEVTAEGMTVNSRAFVSENSATISDFAADTSEPCKIVLSWKTTGVAPADGWLLMYTRGDSEQQEVIRTNKDSAELSNAIPGETYRFVLQASDGTTVFDGTFECAVPTPVSFTGYSVSAERMTFSMCPTPDKENWKHSDVKKADYTTTFSIGQKASFVVKLNKKYLTSSDIITTMFVIRDSEGKVISANTSAQTWTSMWYQYYCELDVPALPDQAGSYIMQIYFNGMFAHEQAFTVTE